MTQLKSQLESITLTLKFKLKPATVSLLRFTDEKIISEQEALKVVATSGESSKKRQSNVKVEELHLDSTESSSKRKSVNLNKSPSNLSTVLKEIKTETPKTKGAKKSFDDGENPMTTDIPEVPESSTSFEKKKRARKMTKKLIKKMLDLHGLTECYVKAEKLSDEDIAHHLANLGKIISYFVKKL